MLSRHYLLVLVVLVVGCLVVLGLRSLERHAPANPPADPAPNTATAASATAASATAASATAASATATRPNVLLVLLDALRYDRLAATRNGVPVMPYLSKLAEESVRFTHASTPCTWTRPAMASIFTSFYVDAHQVYFGADPNIPNDPLCDRLSDHFETMASYLKKAGYHTVAFQTNGNVVEQYGFTRGFDQYEFKSDAPGAVVTAWALQHLQNLAEPFFLYLHYMDPHLPYTPPAEYKALFGWPPPLTPAELKTAENFMDYFWDYSLYRIGQKPAPSKPPLSPEGQEAVRTLYDGEVRFLDDQVAKFLEPFRARWSNTIVIILADHGEHFWDHGYLGHGLTMYEEELHVPLVMLGPGLTPRAIDRKVSTVNVLPTLAELLGLPPNAAWQGKSLFAADASEDEAIFSRTCGPWKSCNTDLEMVKAGSLKLIANHRTNGLELYDLIADPFEKTNLAPDRPREVEALQARLDTHRAQNEKARGGRQPETVGLDDASKEVLRAQGYLPTDK